MHLLSRIMYLCDIFCHIAAVAPKEGAADYGRRGGASGLAPDRTKRACHLQG